MKIVIDEKKCVKHKLTLEEFLLSYVYGHIQDLNKVIDNLVAREILVKQDSDYLVTQHWADVVDEILCDSIQETAKTDEELMALAQKMRELYPQGKMPNSPYYYRCNNKEVMLKLKKFFITYGEYTDEQILEATKKYVAAFNGNYKYLPLIKYFISKMKPVQDEEGVVKNIEHSPLADCLENMNDKDININDDSWLINIRN